MFGTAEEVKDSSATLPKALIWSFTFNAILGFIMAVTLCFTLGNVEEILETATGMQTSRTETLGLENRLVKFMR